ncbi:MAG: cryptochrome/photolyase family protein [Pseudomonadales bacterium]|jgi:deoxyribodipyrimidine photolyase-related protein|nr:cryptochrome/photolyase family protein [Pseudomonadales bacterium]
MTDRIVLVLGDQVGARIPALDGTDPDGTRVLLAEVASEVGYAPHHAKKIALVFSAMRHCAERLRGDGWQVDYVRLDDAGNSGSLTGELERAVAAHGAREVRVTEPGEWRVREGLRTWGERADVDFAFVEDDRFLADRAFFANWAKNRKTLRMEYFYREMRRRHDLLMEDGAPAGGEWNYDADNRRKLPPPGKRPRISGPMQFTPDAITGEVLELVREHCADAFGDLEPFWFAVTPGDAKRAFAHFLEYSLPYFGDYQDAMAADEDFVFHSIISMYVNIGLLDPLECCRRAEEAWRDGNAPLNAVEGFVRQILGWREFVRGVYWLKMPDYAQENALAADRPLPDFYWSGETDMRCMREAIGATRRNAYAHHIQRLMVTGNFALLAGIRPAEVADWYLGVYADAFEWVELPNVAGMALFADGGVFASKPYAASGKYIDRMSDYCKGCRYDVKASSGEDACPFNYLYWDFVARNRETLAGNARMGMMYRNLDKQDPERVAAMRADAERARADLDAL